ncbi:hypothetical protein [Kushneria sinocarnis]|nr:hypothetical protein [Kushneria sinocarnis]
MAYIRTHYGYMPTREIAKKINRTPWRVKAVASEMGLKHPLWNSGLRIERFERETGKNVDQHAIEYRDRQLARRDLAGVMGVSVETLKKFVSAEIWQSWPKATLAHKRRCKERSSGVAA